MDNHKPPPISSSSSSNLSPVSSSGSRPATPGTPTQNVDDDGIELISVVIRNNINSLPLYSPSPPHSLPPSPQQIVSPEEQPVIEEDRVEELELLEQLEEKQRSVNAKLKKLKKCLKKKTRKPNSSEEVVNGHHVVNSSLVPPISLSVEERESVLKRKLEMATAELSKSRTEQIKKLKKSVVREEMVIDVPDFPIEFYLDNFETTLRIGNLQEWYRKFRICVRFRTNPEYRQWVQNRINGLLPEVLKIMCKVWNKMASTRLKIVNADLLKCRLVNKSWKQYIDQFLQQYSRDHSCDDEMGPISTKICSTKCNKFVNLVCEMGTSSMSQNNQHPFPSRSVSVSARPLKNRSTTIMFKGTVDMLLHLYGNDVHCFSYHGYPDPPPETQVSRGESSIINGWPTVREWLEKMTELRRLHISLPYAADSALLEGPSLSTWNIQNPTFPILPKLTTVECRHVPGTLVDALLNANKQVKIQHIFQLSGQCQPNWETLINLSLHEFSLNVLKSSHIKPLEIAQWPIRKLILTSNGISEEFMDIGILFETLGRFKETLIDLSLNVKVGGSSERNLTLELPHLKNLSLALMEESSPETGKLSYDFMLPLIALKMLKIELERETDPGDVENGKVLQVVQIRSYINRFYESNIWKLFPCLKNIKACAYYGQYNLPKEYKYYRYRIK